MKFDNKYFNATLPVWIDEFTDELLKEANVEQSNNELMASQLWTDAFCSDEEDVKMVRDSILAVVYTFDPSPNPDNLEKGPAKDLKKYFDGQVANVLRFVDKLDEDGWDGIVLAVAKKKLTADSKPIKHSAERTLIINHVTELFSDHGIDVLDMADSGVSSDGDRLGIAGLKDKLETHIALWATLKPTLLPRPKRNKRQRIVLTMPCPAQLIKYWIVIPRPNSHLTRRTWIRLLLTLVLPFHCSRATLWHIKPTKMVKPLIQTV